jgi:RNA polymerase sigma-70 factor (ECF subfamily)
MLDDRHVTRPYERSHAAKWRVPRERFAGALEASVAKAFAGETAEAREVARYLDALHLDDLALACACADGDEEAWQQFVTTYRPVLYRAALAIDASGSGRELADSLYADLFGLGGRAGERQSLFRYFHGRSSLATWLRAVLAQRHVDRVRAVRRTTALPDDEGPRALEAPSGVPDPHQARYARLMAAALAAALAGLAAADRLRLACYHAQQMTLAQIGRLLGEHEGTVSRHLARARRLVRADVEARLREQQLSPAEIDACFAAVLDDPGALDVEHLLGSAAASRPDPGPANGRKNASPDRSTTEGGS